MTRNAKQQLERQRLEARLRELRGVELGANLARHAALLAEPVIATYQFLQRGISGNRDFSPLELTMMGVGAGLMAAGSVVTYWNNRTTMETIIENQGTTDKRLATAGYNRYTRNPCYTGQTLAATGVALLSPTATMVAALASYIGLTEWCVRDEERTSALQFGKKYERYKERVQRWPSPKSLYEMIRHPIIASGVREKEA
jgi:protein-S-isoprenylcysteine O-methyltransferase Ste14